MTAVGEIAYGWPMLSGAAGSGRLRAITAVIALYALVLQAVLGGMMPAHAAGLDGALCLGLSDGGPAPDGGKGLPAAPHKHADCCTAAHAPAGAEPPRPLAFGLSWEARPVLRVRWDASEQARPRAPPGLSARPRGPPAV
ncbi:hypothetical protein [Methylobacterium sp. sgz302541]|uniref:hypothetical protein n=1 Tax=unclassified Methylobacterium TaxID=2615210 RepID=UPI003D32E495